jgi:hypothetical protein
MMFRQLCGALALLTLSGCCCHRHCRTCPPPEGPACGPVPVAAPPGPGVVPAAPIPAQPVPVAPASQRVARVSEGPY